MNSGRGNVLLLSNGNRFGGEDSYLMSVSATPANAPVVKIESVDVNVGFEGHTKSKGRVGLLLAALRPSPEGSGGSAIAQALPKQDFLALVRIP